MAHASARGITLTRYNLNLYGKILRQSTAEIIHKRKYGSHAHFEAMNARPTGFNFNCSSGFFTSTNADIQRRRFCSTKGLPEDTGSSMLPKKKIILNDTFQKDRRDAKDEVTISIDVKTLFDPKIHLSDKPDFNDPSLGYEVSTPLSDELIKLIALAYVKKNDGLGSEYALSKFSSITSLFIYLLFIKFHHISGPITLAEYMKQALTHPDYGYYTRKIEHDDFYDDEDADEFDGKTKNTNHVTLIGKHGDFTTAPEVSQIFGESILIWFIYQWRQTLMVKEKALTFIEVGPGRGTLMADILGSSLKSFPDFVEALCRGGGIHLVETSSSLRELQRVAIQRAFDNGNTGAMKLLFCDDNPCKIDDNDSVVLRVQWHEILGTVPNTPKNGPQMFIAQEFIDALPVHSFQKTAEDGVWRERLVDVDAIDLDNFVSPNSTPFDKSKDETAKSIVQPPDKKSRLRFILSPTVTPALRSLMKTDECGRVQGDRRISDDAVDGDVLEVCPEGLSFVQDVSGRINLCGGACLIVDYGSGKGTGDSIRAFKRHKQVPVLSLPGEVDITSDVDFHALYNAVNGSGGHRVKAFGPVNQGTFLAFMGIVERVEHLIDDDQTTEKQATDLYHALERLLLPDQMGERYQVLAMVRNDENNPSPPAGFQ